jgi:predicted nucleic acid-binding protein
MIGLDTCAIIDLLQNKIPAQYFTQQYAISVLVKYEFLLIASESESKVFEQLWTKAKKIDLTEASINMALKTQTKARSAGKEIPFADCLIGASYLEQNLPILTANKKDFEKIPNLKVISY